jgi:hydrogenase-4 component E
MDSFALDVAHLFAGGLVLVSFMLLYQDRMFGLLNIFALHALVVSLSVAWQAHIQQAPHLYITEIALVSAVIPIVLHHHRGWHPPQHQTVVVPQAHDGRNRARRCRSW